MSFESAAKMLGAWMILAGAGLAGCAGGPNERDSIADYPAERVDSVDALIDLADRRLYQAKHAGRNCYVLAEGAKPVPILA